MQRNCAVPAQTCYQRAYLQAPCILFIDEFDGLGKARSHGGMGSDESVHTINQLLTGGRCLPGDLCCTAVYRTRWVHAGMLPGEGMSPKELLLFLVTIWRFHCSCGLPRPNPVGEVPRCAAPTTACLSCSTLTHSSAPAATPKPAWRRDGRV